MRGRAVTLVLRETVVRVKLVILRHHLVARYFGDDGRRRDRVANEIPFDDRLLSWKGERSFDLAQDRLPA